MKILAFDSSNQPLVVAVAENDQVLATAADLDLRSHSVKLLPLIDQLMQKVGWQPQDLDRIVVAQGPGSFTGVRLAVTTAKVLAWTLGIELVGVSSLAVCAQSQSDFSGLIIPWFNARNQNIFTGIYRFQTSSLQTISPDQHLSWTTLLSRLAKVSQPLCLVGADLTLPKQALADFPQVQAQLVEEKLPQAQALVQLGYLGQPVTDLDHFSPRYLRKTQAELTWQEKNPQLKENTDYVEDV
ncbi:tRNA (adenosine(37)-N6)-threonylcarbamoyltransferase complex dimerization subunit type 1 TsaB [Lactobacillus sp. DCY120]|uniref:tRNA (Adenosine(37)-N6)-threonylcarbamoyltransferase complex dimerization subunit type 1 TsaB n=1 Tax=Bombilactobacillus apium TaxID=2675299 RepID=A0A850R979_9LACO|nr:tRNA (adenosine(37)-N6)-threonylcarbamoyltransferase complex dimerization subunit type 1 TsaB [Bombilactobacillus apium]NVY95956.1 tRNA (adenosine(37)-N6)-threonylcarbamoyltransferase complex dimerization subunit type 1 TsaB [Bombilactobacillus apium]